MMQLLRVPKGHRRRLPARGCQRPKKPATKAFVAADDVVSGTARAAGDRGEAAFPSPTSAARQPSQSPRSASVREGLAGLEHGQVLHDAEARHLQLGLELGERAAVTFEEQVKTLFLGTHLDLANRKISSYY
jgi:hypothetical protein